MLQTALHSGRSFFDYLNYIFEHFGSSNRSKPAFSPEIVCRHSCRENFNFFHTIFLQELDDFLHKLLAMSLALAVLPDVNFLEFYGHIFICRQNNIAHFLAIFYGKVNPFFLGILVVVFIVLYYCLALQFLCGIQFRIPELEVHSFKSFIVSSR